MPDYDALDLADPQLQREIRYRKVVRRLEEMIHDRTPAFLPRPRKLSDDEVVELAHMLADCHNV